MKIKSKHILIILVVTAIGLVGGYVLSREGNRTGPPAEDNNPAELIYIEDLLENREEYHGKSVAIRGAIVTQCARGCKFNVDDGTGVIFVEMLEEAWESPLAPSIGKTVEVRGTFYGYRPVRIVVENPEHVQLP